MSNSYKEEHPLLREESEEELQIRHSSPRFQRRFRYSAPGRARAQAKGAATIVTHWPDHLSTLLTYWWIGLAMIAVLIFIIYNCIVAVAILPPVHTKPSKFQNTEYTITNKENVKSSNIFMHIFVSNYEELNMNDYIPYIETFSKKYPNFKYNFIILLKEASKESFDNLSDELKNELALNTLWTEKNNNIRELNEITTIQIIPLSKYMDDSPLKKYWRRLPDFFFGFLSRCISIWDKGGIAFNPIILTPKSPNPIYVEKLEQILSNVKLKESSVNYRKQIPKKQKKTVNNIRDIIETLEDESKGNYLTENMLEVENIENLNKVAYPIMNKVKRNIKPLTQNKHKILNMHHAEENKNVSDVLNSKNNSEFSPSTTSEQNEIEVINDITTKQSLLPMFLDFLFHHRDFQDLDINSKNKTAAQNDAQTRDHFSKNYVRSHESHSAIPIITSSGKGVSKIKTHIKKNEKNMSKNNIQLANQLTIDLEGNLIATETACHAFIGTIFSNIIHHSSEESVKDFIISELSIFCKGVLSSCKGIEVILL